MLSCRPRAQYQLYSMRQQQQENRRIGVEGLRQQIREWNIRYRIQEKISTWGINFSSRKIDSIPSQFVAESFVFYILKAHSQLIHSYDQSFLFSSLFALKKIYSCYSIQYFKENQNFNFSLVVVSKLLRYFLFSAYPELQLPENLQAHIFASITYALIGYPINLNAYSVIEQKMKQKKKDKLDRASQSLDESMENELRKTVDRKIRRWGVKDCLVNGHQNKQLQHFRLQIQQSLRTKLLPLKKQESDKNKLKNLCSSESCYLGFQQIPEISFHQISAAMMANEGFNSPKQSPKMQLSRLNMKKQHVSHASQTLSVKGKENSVSFDFNAEKSLESRQEKSSILTKQSFQKFHCKKFSKKDFDEETHTDSVLLTLDNRLSQDFYSKLKKKVREITPKAIKTKHAKSGNQLLLPKISKE